jgi:DNA repair protein RadC
MWIRRRPRPTVIHRETIHPETPAELTDEELLRLLLRSRCFASPSLEPGLAADEGRFADRSGEGAVRLPDLVREVLRRMSSGRPRPAVPSLRCSADVFALLGPGLARRTHERFLVVGLDARNRPASRHLVAQGSLATCVVHPREVFAPLVRRRAAAAILVHNHPSGDPAPSPEDERLTDRLVAAGSLLGIPVLDHLIVARLGYFSFRDAGRLPVPAA